MKDRDSIVGKITFDDHGQNTVPAITKYVVQDGKWLDLGGERVRERQAQAHRRQVAMSAEPRSRST